MVFKPNFRTGPDSIVTFNFDDISNGQGIVNIFLGRTVDKNKMSSTIWYSDKVFTSTGSITPGVAFVKVLDVDFDMEFNVPTILRGDTIINMPYGCKAVVANTYYAFLIVTVKHWDGATETDLVTNTGGTVFDTLAIGAYVYDIAGIDLNVPNTKFKKGETLRITVEVWGHSAGGGAGGNWFIGHDPQGRVTTSQEVDSGVSANNLTFGDSADLTPSTAIFQMPVRINL